MHFQSNHQDLEISRQKSILGPDQKRPKSSQIRLETDFVAKTLGFLGISILEHLLFRIDRKAQKMDSGGREVGRGGSSLIQILPPSIRVSAIIRFQRREMAPVTELQSPPDSSGVFDQADLFLLRFRCTRDKDGPKLGRPPSSKALYREQCSQE